MTDWFHACLKTLDYHRGKILGGIIMLCIGAMTIGCPPKTQSLADPAKKVTADSFAAEAVILQNELQREYVEYQKQGELLAAKSTALQTQIDVGIEDLEAQIATNKAIIEKTTGIASSLMRGDPVDTVDILASLAGFTLLGISGGAGYDHLKKDRVITSQKKQLVALTNGSTVPPTV